MPDKFVCWKMNGIPDRIIYNSVMKKTLVFLVLSALLVFAFPARVVFSAQQSAEDLVALVNNVRVPNGLSALTEDASLNSAAQAQADFLASQYGPEFTSITDWHTGSNGEDEYSRAIAAGYAISPGWTVDEIAYGGSESSTVTDAYRWWLTSQVHTNAIFSTDAVDIGAGIASGDGYSYFVVIFGVSLGSGASANEGVVSTIPEAAVTPQVAPVSVATPNADGTIFHTVESGQALWSIAIAYDTTIDQILALNNLEANAIIYEGQSLQVRAAFTPTPQPSATNTPLPPTRTPIPAQTAKTVNTPAATEPVREDGLLGLDNQTMGLVLILISGLGLILIVVGNIAKDRTPKNQDKDQ